MKLAAEFQESRYQGREGCLFGCDHVVTHPNHGTIGKSLMIQACMFVGTEFFGPTEQKELNLE